ncbi:MAG: hypothetical protein SZ59_C0003G0093 [candidate division TM6 bacterium GW2011_GWF2_28_16]|nr:MAG: hypothetical protein SZ59_C0003G0093 [candidate division TM6 bacterium GW2011_GWF2_28_16]
MEKTLFSFIYIILFLGSLFFLKFIIIPAFKIFFSTIKTVFYALILIILVVASGLFLLFR